METTVTRPPGIRSELANRIERLGATVTFVAREARTTDRAIRSDRLTADERERVRDVIRRLEAKELRAPTKGYRSDLAARRGHRTYVPRRRAGRDREAAR
jgi:tagatose-1,6-bisphosphate aldolase non-catalytic subunit AgaZ/GatZ